MSEIFKLNWRDLIKGLAVAIIMAVLTLIIQLLQSGTAFNLKQVGITALTAGLSYLLKNFISDENGKLGGRI